ncbi:hypothetical protein BDN70DRAFT_878251 [Pholiota conissans]|uniref:Cation/H+ exchanger transmembrane domain-containing protein n=1 Tax=Pholiota conissans TaxID=109636 RepID=A0A9P5Z4K9_9AGAR|nr:hypothetical protein BDN70DRAFT_878251 [Pholiota conissans]
MFDPFEVSTVHIVYALLGGFIVLFGMFSLFLRERLYIGEAIWAFLFGIIIGPYCANVFDPRSWGNIDDETTNLITLEFTRIVLAIGVFAIGVELPKAYMWKHLRSLFFLLVPVMTWGWFVSGGLIFALIPGLNFLSSLAVAACLTPTDPILAAAVVGGKWADKHVPAHIRHLLAAESGCNDGAAFPFLFISLYLIMDKPHTGEAIRDWILQLWLYQVLLGILIGSMLGYAFRHLMKFCQRHDLIDRQSYVAQYVSLAILTIGVCTLLGSDDLLASFFCGTAFAWDGFFNKQTEESVFSSVIDTLFNVAAFIFVGAWMPFSSFQNAELTLSVWRLIVIAILILLLRRLPIMIMTYRWIPDIKTFREAVFSGHFGPIGIGAVFISTLAVETLDKANLPPDHQTELLKQTIQPIVAFMVLCSITIHGLSIPSFSLGRRVHSVSRTWSRRETLTSQPDWTNQARIVTRREDIVINRDLEKGEASPSEVSEKGQRTTPSEHTLEALPGMEDSGISEETKVTFTEPPASPPHPHVRISPPVTASPSVAPETETETEARPDYREQVPPDATAPIQEWIEGSHTVIEKKMGPGSDVEVTVVDTAHPEGPSQPRTTWSGKIHELENNAEEIGHSISRDLTHLSDKAKHVVHPHSSYPYQHRQERRKEKQRAVDTSPRPSEALDENAVDDEDDDEGWASEGSNGPVASMSAPGTTTTPGAGTTDVGGSGSGKKTAVARSASRLAKGAHGVHHAMRGRWRQSRRSSFGATPPGPPQAGDAGVEERQSRGRGPRAGGDVDLSSAGAATGANGPSSPRAGARPGTADSALKHNRLDSIRALHSRPPTRENSPSRSVRFLDADSRVASSRSVVGLGLGESILQTTSPVSERPPPPSEPSSRGPSRPTSPLPPSSSTPP